MYKEIVPMLSKGTFALYYGGPEIVEKLNDKPSSITRLDTWILHTFFSFEFNSPLFVLFSAIFQLLFILFKWRKTKEMDQLKRDPGTYIYYPHHINISYHYIYYISISAEFTLRQLMLTWFSGFNNIFSFTFLSKYNSFFL